jgi:hypothetical protein
MKEMFDDPKMYRTYTGKPLSPDDFANPCGLIARAYFNEEYELYNPKSLRVPINETDIANIFDRSDFFKRNVNSSDLQWIDVENEHFMIWMNMETYNNFRKLWGRIENDLPMGNYTLKIKDCMFCLF